MGNIISDLCGMAGCYSGEGVEHMGNAFRGELTVAPIVQRRGISLKFVAKAPGGQVLQEEHTVIAPLMGSAQIVLWTLGSNLGGMLFHEMRRDELTPDGGRAVTFGSGDAADLTRFRQEITIEILRDGRIGYRYAWGRPGAEFVPRSGVRMARSTSDLDPNAR